MKRVLCKLAVAASLLVGTTSCYDDVVRDYDYSTSYFAQQQPLRTVIDGREGVAEANEISVGAAIGGKLNVDLNDWAKFIVDEAPITTEMGKSFAELGLEVMPEDYYELSDPEKMVIRKSNNYIMEVDVKFTDKFFNDPQAIASHYAIPFVLVDSSCDSLLSKKYYSVVAVKYQSKYHGNYYVKGFTAERDGNNYGEIITYDNDDLSQNLTSEATTTGRYSITRVGQTLTIGTSSISNGNVNIEVPNDATLNEDGSVDAIVTAAVGDVAFVTGTGSGKVFYDEESHDCRIEITYLATADGKYYEVKETLIRRNDPIKDLRVEFWVAPTE